MAKATAIVVAILLGVFVASHEAAVCFDRLKLFRQHEMLQSPEIYLVCNDGTSKKTDIVHITCNYYTFDPELCIDIDLEEPVKCQFLTSDGPYDENKASFTIDETTFAIGDQATETDEESLYVMLRMTDEVDSEDEAQDATTSTEPEGYQAEEQETGTEDEEQESEDEGHHAMEPQTASQPAESTDDLE